MERDQIDAALAARLVAGQFPEWAGLPVTDVEAGGWDNRTFRLGDTMSVRLPSAADYAAAIDKEHEWLPRLAPVLPVPVPVPLALGAATAEYPWPWSVRGWIPGTPASPTRVGVAFARDLAVFLIALHRADASGGPVAGVSSFFRGASLRAYDAETRHAVSVLGDRVDGATALAVWDAALDATWTGTPAWFHGDIAAGNLLVGDDGRLAAVIDFGTCGVGDPACDLVIAWTLFAGDSRTAFRAILPADDAMWARGRGWALWKALITIDSASASPKARNEAAMTAEVVLAEHRAQRAE